MLHHEFAGEANLVRVIDHTLDQRLDCIYDDDPLGFEKDPMTFTEKIQAHDSLEEINLWDKSIKRHTYISTKVYPNLKNQVIQLLNNYKDFFTWDYNEMP